MPVRCLNCGTTFADVEAYERHQWNEHGGELDRGVTFSSSGRWSLARGELLSAAECPEPPRLEDHPA